MENMNMNDFTVEDISRQVFMIPFDTIINDSNSYIRTTSRNSPCGNNVYIYST